MEIGEEYKLEDVEEEYTEPEQYRHKIDLTDEQETELIALIEANLNKIDKQRQEDGMEERHSSLQNQYWGVVNENPNLLFNTHIFLTLTHCRRAKSRVFQAFFESDPIFSVSPRPGISKGKGYEDAELQEQFLDYEIDSEVHIRAPMRKVLQEAFLLDGGVIKLIWEKDEEWVKRIEEYKGTQKGLERFLDNYPDARSDYPGYVRRLEAGTDIRIMAHRKIPVYDAPKFYYVPFKDFYIDINVDGLEGLRKEKFFGERQSYSYYELLEEVEEERFDKEKVEELQWILEGDSLVIDPRLIEREFNVFECNLIYDLNKNGKPRRIIVWYVRDRRKIIAACEFIYEHGRPYYIPFFVTEELAGWLQPGLGRVLTHSNIIANASTNLMLDNAFYGHIPLLRAKPNSNIAQQLLARSWKLGDPLIADKGDVEKFDLNSGNLSDLMNLIQLNDHNADNVSGVGSAYMSGKADPIDPDAPARKAMALLRESNINVKDYILALMPSFQEMAYQLLQLFAQFKGTSQFEFKKKAVLGRAEIFNKEITTEQLRLRTNITPSAYSFNFDKANEKRDNLALLKILTENPVARKFLDQMPQADWALFHIFIKSFSDFWNAKVDEVWPTEKQVKDFMVDIQKEAFEKLYQEKVKENQARFTGRPVRRPSAPGQGQPGGGAAPGVPLQQPQGGM